MNIELNGWTLVHVYHESHGDHDCYFYQKNRDNPIFYKPQLLMIYKYRDKSKSDSIVFDNNQFTHDYLLAVEIRNNPDRYIAVKHGTEPCGTAGYDDFTDTKTDTVYRIYGVAGHGEWAFEVKDE